MAAEVGQEGMRLTRDELYERVWAEPMATLAPQLGISDVALKKTCSKMRIPTPYRGYWARKSAGQSPRRTPLPKLPASTQPSLLTAVFGRQPKATAVAVDATGPVADQARYEQMTEHRITVPELLAEPHPLVAASIHLLRRAKPDAEHRLLVRGKQCLALSVTMDTVDRAMCIYDALLKALGIRGYAVEVTSGDKTTTTTVLVGEERVQIMIEERVDRILRKPEPRDAKDRFPVYGPQYDVVPTGRLTLRILDGYLKLRRSWSDGVRQRVEDCLNGFIVGLVAAAEALRELRLEQEGRHREWYAAEKRRLLEEQRRRTEASRVRALDSSVAAWRKSVIVRDYVQAMRAAAEGKGAIAADSPLAQWLDWAEGYAERLDPTQLVPAVPTDPE